MGAYTQEVRNVLDQLGNRFDTEEAITEISALQRQFTIFARSKCLNESFAALNIEGDWPCHLGWQLYLKKLHQYDSDHPGMNGHDRVVDAFRSNLEQERPQPMLFRIHQAEEDSRVLVRTEESRLVISFPVCPPHVAAHKVAA